MNQLSETNEYKQIGRRIRRFRNQSEMTQDELATAVGFGSQTAIQYIEAGKRRLRVMELKQIAKVLGVTPDQILNDDRQIVEISHPRPVKFDDDKSEAPRIETHVKVDEQGKVHMEDKSNFWLGKVFFYPD